MHFIQINPDAPEKWERQVENYIYRNLGNNIQIIRHAKDLEYVLRHILGVSGTSVREALEVRAGMEETFAGML
jgi:hypothetical protein